jgi:hypothetical protein
MSDAPSLVLTVPAPLAASLQVNPALSVGFQSVTAGVYSINGVLGYVGITGVDSVVVTQSGQLIVISGAVPTGIVTPAQLAATGQAAWQAGQDNATNLSGSLVSTSGALVARDASISGGLEARIAATGAAAVAYANAISGAVAGSTSGFATLSQLASTGQQAWSAADNNARNLSGNLTQTGVALVAQVNSTGAASVAYTNTVSGALQAGIAATGAAGVAYVNAISGALYSGATGFATLSQ